MKINEVAKLTGVTVRTLHYYDQIGLLSPKTDSDNKYRIYEKCDLEILQQILFFRELDFPLNVIKEMLGKEKFDRREALEKQKELLIAKRNRLDGLIQLVDDTIKGDTEMSFKEFDMSEIDSLKEKYTAEVQEKWGDSDAYKQNQKKTAGYKKEDWQKVTEHMDALLKKFAALLGTEPADERVQELVEQWQNWITENYYDCTKEILVGLGQMYVADERFTKNMDKFGEGTAKLISDGIAVFCA